MNIIYRGRTVREFYLASILYDCIEDLNFSAIKTLLEEKRADPNIVLPKKGIAPFHLIIGNDNQEFAIKVTRLILQNGGNPNVRSEDGLTPLHIAAAWGRKEIVNILLASGADPDLKDNNYITPMQYAYDENHHDVVALIKVYVFSHDICIEPKKHPTSYSIKFDKIEVNNDQVIEEYELDDEMITNKESSFTSLKLLPQTNSIDYVNNWCDTHVMDANIKQENTECKPFNSGCQTEESDSCETTTYEYESSDDSLDFTFENRKRNFNKRSKKVKVELRNASSLHDDLLEKCISSSKESGIMTLPNTPPAKYVINETIKDTSSDYFTCSGKHSPDIFEKNIFEVEESKLNDNHIDEVTSDFSSSYNSRTSQLNNRTVSVITDQSNDSNLSFVTVSEVYKHIDETQGVVLLEKHLLKNPARDLDESIKSSISSQSSILNMNYDSETLRKELQLEGFNPGPITNSTKRIYLKKLKRLKKNCSDVFAAVTVGEIKRKTYSFELEKTIRDPNWKTDLTAYRELEDVLLKQFSLPDPSRKWREGVTKSSFTYLLLDPRYTSNLPCRAELLQPKEIWEVFLNAIFYVGKGKRSRPYSHLYDAASLWKTGTYSSSNKKLQRILDIWKANSGVVCLHVFQNTIPVEAYTREAAMISALNVENIENIKSGDFYGIANTWTSKQKKLLGVFLLYKAMLIFLNEGERQLYPADIE